MKLISQCRPIEYQEYLHTQLLWGVLGCGCIVKKWRLSRRVINKGQDWWLCTQGSALPRTTHAHAERPQDFLSSPRWVPYIHMHFRAHENVELYLRGMINCLKYPLPVFIICKRKAFGLALKFRKWENCFKFTFPIRHANDGIQWKRRARWTRPWWWPIVSMRNLELWTRLPISLRLKFPFDLLAKHYFSLWIERVGYRLLRLYYVYENFWPLIAHYKTMHNCELTGICLFWLLPENGRRVLQVSDKS